MNTFHFDTEVGQLPDAVAPACVTLFSHFVDVPGSHPYAITKHPVDDEQVPVPHLTWMFLAPEDQCSTWPHPWSDPAAAQVCICVAVDPALGQLKFDEAHAQT